MNDMENIEYKLKEADGEWTLSIFTVKEIGENNERALGICAYRKHESEQIDWDIDNVEEIDSLIGYLKLCKKYIAKGGSKDNNGKEL